MSSKIHHPIEAMCDLCSERRVSGEIADVENEYSNLKIEFNLLAEAYKELMGHAMEMNIALKRLYGPMPIGAKTYFDKYIEDIEK